MTTISNTGPLIALAKIDQLELLPLMFETVAIPPAVQRELLAKSGIETRRLDVALAKYIQIVDKPELSSAVQIVTDHLGAGEQQAIALAHANNALLIIDERLGRQAARQLDLKMTGSAGLLIEAKKRGLVSAVRPLLEALRRQGYWLSDELIAIASRKAGE
jgi:hypothetical protein